MLNGVPQLTTSDKLIRKALIKELKEAHPDTSHTRIVEELKIKHGEARVDVAVVNGILHGYELKSDVDSLLRLPNQMRIYNSVFDQITIVVGKNHLFKVINIIPDWWGVTIAKTTTSNETLLLPIRNSTSNPKVDSMALARLLLKSEAISILQELKISEKYKSKKREYIIQLLINNLKQQELKAKVRNCLFKRLGHQSDVRQQTNDD